MLYAVVVVCGNGCIKMCGMITIVFGIVVFAPVGYCNCCCCHPHWLFLMPSRHIIRLLRLQLSCGQKAKYFAQ